jgi:hypothetical protein
MNNKKLYIPFKPIKRGAVPFSELMKKSFGKSRFKSECFKKIAGLAATVDNAADDATRWNTIIKVQQL